MEREVGGGIGMGNTCKPMAVSFQCMTKSTTNKKVKKKILLSFPQCILLDEHFLELRELVSPYFTACQDFLPAFILEYLFLTSDGTG